MMLAYGIPSQIVKDIKGLYLDTMAQVVTEDGNTDFFPIVTGVHHCLRLCNKNCNGQR